MITEIKPNPAAANRTSLAVSCLLFASLVALGVLGRVGPHLPNATPVAATGLFASFYFRRRAVAVAVPLLAMSISDLWLGGYDRRQMLVVYAALMAPAMLGPWIHGRFKWFRIWSFTAGGSCLFYLASNAAVWVWATYYTPDLSGLMKCLAAGLPFLKNTLKGDFAYATAIFGAHSLEIVCVGFLKRVVRSASANEQPTIAVYRISTEFEEAVLPASE